MHVLPPLLLLLPLLLALASTPRPAASEVIRDPVPASVRPDLSSLPIYEDFFDRLGLYRRAHVHLLGLEGKKSLGFSWNINSPEAYAIAETYGSDTGSADYFAIGSHTFKTVESTNDIDGYLFEWDAKQLLLYKTDGTEGISFSVYDEDVGSDDVLMKFNVTAADLPPAGGGYREFRRQSDVTSDYDEVEGADLVFRIKVTEMSVPIASEEKLLGMTHDFSAEAYPDIEYDEHVLELTETGSTHQFQNGTDRALVQSWRHVGANASEVEGAVLWIVGRNDVFMHPHVCERLFFGRNSSHALDVYVLNWRLNGLAMHRGWVTDAFYVSHNAYGDFDVYDEEMKKSLALMKSLGPAVGGTYAKVVGYAHSTGGTILANYLRRNGPDEFDGVVLNSPFFDWAESSVMEFGLETVADVLAGAGVWDEEHVVFSKSTPEAYDDSPVEYLGREVVMSAWAARISSNHPRPWSWRIAYSSALTVGFVDGASDLFEELEDSAPIAPTLPILVLASIGDDVLDGEEIGELSKWLSETRRLVTFRHNGHDVFLSADAEDEDAAMGAVEGWLGQVLACEGEECTAILGDGKVLACEGEECKEKMGDEASAAGVLGGIWILFLIAAGTMVTVL